jgi:adenosylcobyric acid synthase
VRTEFAAAKTTRLREGAGPDGAPVRGYEIRHGRSRPLTGWVPWLSLGDEGGDGDGDREGDGVASAVAAGGLVVGTSLHGLFEEDAFRASFLTSVALSRGKSWLPSGYSFAAARQHQLDRVADACAAHLDLDALWRLVDQGSAGLCPAPAIPPEFSVD